MAKYYRCPVCKRLIDEEFKDCDELVLCPYCCRTFVIHEGNTFVDSLFDCKGAAFYDFEKGGFYKNKKVW